MIDEEELAADVLELIAELVEEGSLELATRYDANSIAEDLAEQLEHDPNIDFEEWLLDRDEVVELYADADTLKARIRPILTRIAHGDKEATWNDSLAAAIIAHPDDDHARLVLGDWLEQHGDARGELCSLQAAIMEKMKEGSGGVTLPDDHPLRRRERSLLARFRTHLFGDLPPDQTLTFRHGFFDAAIIDGVHLEQLMKLRSASFLRRLNVRLDTEKSTEVAARIDLPKTLVALELSGPREAGLVRVGQPISDGLPQLTNLRVHGDKVRINSLSFRALESLHIGAVNEVRVDNTAMGMIDLPKLRALTIDAPARVSSDTNSNTSDRSAEEDKNSSSIATFVETIFAHPPPRLIKLDIGSICDGPMLAKLALSPLLTKLKELHLKGSQIRCADLQQHILVNPLLFHHLAELHLEGCAATYEVEPFERIASDVRKVCAKVFLRYEPGAPARSRAAAGGDEEDDDGEEYDDYDNEDEDEDDEYGDEGYDDDNEMANADRSEPEIEDDDDEEDVAEEKQEPTGVDADAPLEERHISRDPDEEDTAAREGLDDERYEGPRE